MDAATGNGVGDCGERKNGRRREREQATDEKRRESRERERVNATKEE